MDNIENKLIRIKEHAQTGIQQCLDLIGNVECLEQKGTFETEDAERFKNRYNTAIRTYRENILLVNGYFKEKNIMEHGRSI